MNVLVLGSGGREHSICLNLKKSKKLKNLWCIPGNAGTKEICNSYKDKLDNNDKLLGFCKKKKISLVIPGSEEYLDQGISDLLRLSGIKVFGPSKKATLLESSKIFTKRICDLAEIKTARWFILDNYKEAKKKLKSLKFPLVIKLDSLAAGKGVLVANTYNEAKKFLSNIEKGKIGNKKSKIIIENKIKGKEASFFFAVDGISSVFLGSAQDYKRVGENNTGLNTGGMGCISPSPLENKKNINIIKEKFIQPTIEAMNVLGYPFKGVLYAGLMFNKSDIFLIEYNVRLGDPESQAIMSRLKTNFLDICLAVENKNLNKINIKFDKKPSLCLVLASIGYPGNYKKGYLINDLEKVDKKNSIVIHAGTKIDNKKKIYTNGGRVLNLVILAKNIKLARLKVYELVKNIKCKNLFYRKDIGN